MSVFWRPFAAITVRDDLSSIPRCVGGGLSVRVSVVGLRRHVQQLCIRIHLADRRPDSEGLVEVGASSGTCATFPVQVGRGCETFDRTDVLSRRFGQRTVTNFTVALRGRLIVKVGVLWHRTRSGRAFCERCG